MQKKLIYYNESRQREFFSVASQGFFSELEGERMLFSSLIFLFIFLPFTLVIHTLLPKNKPQKFRDDGTPLKKPIQYRNIFLLIMSLIFYAWGGIYYLLIMLFVIALNYIGGLLIQKFTNNHKAKKTTLILTIIANLVILFFFKYFNFVFDAIMTITSLKVDIIKIALPIGISFFIFQAMAYTIDVYQGKTKAQKNLGTFALYVSLFPQLIAGPIVQYKDVEDQLSNRTITGEMFYNGTKRFIYGLAKKVLIANTVAEVVDKIFMNNPEYLGSSVAWVGIILYALQIYFDFSGYSCMAIGIGMMLGFQFKENFNHPYIATSAQDFWRRWHISLSSWFKEYVYIPLGGSHVKSKWRVYFNLAVVWTLTGIWHGANYTFIIWGWWWLVFLVLERLFLKEKVLEKNTSNKFFNWLYTMLVILIGWVFFRSENINYAFKYIAEMFSFHSGEQNIMYYLTMNSLIALPFGLLFAGFIQTRPFVTNTIAKIKSKKVASNILFYLESCLVFVMLAICIIILANNTYNPFIYFQF